MEQTQTTMPKRKSGSFYLQPQLPFPEKSLEPFMSEQTIKVHYGKHHKGYVEKLNRLIQGTEYENMSIEDVVRKSSGPLYNNAAQAWNHSFFWNCLTPKSSEPTAGALFDCIEHCFGSLPEFKLRLSKTGEDLFGSGYVWLVKDEHGLLDLRAGSNAFNPLTENLTPIFTVDVWEHAYYLDYMNVRKTYLENIWKITNWDFIGANFSRH